jgi:hypothetical protein
LPHFAILLNDKQSIDTELANFNRNWTVGNQICNDQGGCRGGLDANPKKPAGNKTIVEAM